MVNKEKDILLEIIHNSENYFIPISINENWEDIGVIDKVKLCMVLDDYNFSYCCGHSFANGHIWTIRITFLENISSSLFKHSKTSSFLSNEQNVETLDLYVTKQEIDYLRKIVFYNDKSDFWKIK